MISSKDIKKLAEKYDKKIGKSALDKVQDILSAKAEEIIKSAARQADFRGRRIIKIEDFD